MFYYYHERDAYDSEVFPGPHSVIIGSALTNVERLSQTDASIFGASRGGRRNWSSGLGGEKLAEKSTEGTLVFE